MGTRERILTIRLLDRLMEHPGCAESLKIEGAVAVFPAEGRTEQEVVNQPLA